MKCNFKMTESLAGYLALVALVFFPILSSATGILYQFNTPFPTDPSPAGATPLLTADFENVNNGVSLTISAAGLTGSEFASEVYFNLAASLNPSSLTFTQTVSTGAFSTPTIDHASQNNYKADGDGKYDFRFNFGTASGTTFSSGDSITYLIAGIPGLVAVPSQFIPQPFHDFLSTVKSDYKISDHHSLFLRFALQKQYAYDDQFVAVNSTNQPHPDTNPNSSYDINHSTLYSVVGGETWLIGNSSVNTITVQSSYYDTTQLMPTTLPSSQWPLQNVTFPSIELGRTGPSTDQDVLERLALQHSLPAKIIEQRQLSKLKGTYLDALPKMVNANTGRIHCSFNQVVAATGRPQEADYLKALGAATIMDRKEVVEAPDRPLLSERFAGVVDTVSGVMFAKALAQVKYGGAAAVCGLAGGTSFPGSILPFILRGVSVYGIDSVMLPKGPREEAWRRLGTDLPLDKLDSTVSEVGLFDVMALAPRILKGEVRGRIVVDVAR